MYYVPYFVKLDHHQQCIIFLFDLDAAVALRGDINISLDGSVIYSYHHDSPQKVDLSLYLSAVS